MIGPRAQAPRLLSGSRRAREDNGALAVVSLRHARTPRRLLSEELRTVWPLASICLGMPLWFLAGSTAVGWFLPGVVFGMALLRKRHVRLPRGAGLLLALMGWMALSGVQVRGTQAMVLFGWRLGLFAAMVATFLWLCNLDTRTLPTAVLVRLLASLWLLIVVFGYLAILLPDSSWPTLTQKLLPATWANDPFVSDLTSIRFSELQNFLGYPVPRPSAPFAYANGWGSALGVLTPFFLLSWVFDAPPRRRRWGTVLLLVGLVPAMVSLNRGLWISTGVALLFVACRNALLGNVRMAAAVLGGGVALVLIVAVTPLGGLVVDRMAGAEDSNTTRASVYEEAVAYAARSPLLGYGAPVPVARGPAVGTHGYLWYLMVSHGLPALGLFLFWLGGLIRRGLSLLSPTGVWATASLLAVVVQLPIYGLLPQIVLVGVAAAIVWRERYPELAARPAWWGSITPG